MARRFSLALVLAALVLTASATAASTVPYKGASYISAPALTGEHVLFAEYPGNNSVRVSSIPTAGGPKTSLLTATATTSIGAANVSYDGTDARIYVARYLDPGPATMLSGPPTGPLATVEDCAGERDYEYGAPGPAVDGDVAAWAGAECHQRRIHIQTGSTSRVVDAGDFVYDVAVGGGWVAWLRMVKPADPKT